MKQEVSTALTEVDGATVFVDGTLDEALFYHICKRKTQYFLKLTFRKAYKKDSVF